MAQRRRQDLIMELIQQNGFVTTEQLVDQFKVTPQTIRRDLNDLASQKKLRRHHGGAGIDSSTVNTAYQARKIMDLEAKERIAEALVDMIPDNSSMFINIGTTTETIAKALLEKNNLQVVTNNLHVASILSAKEDFHIIIAGGEVRNRDGGSWVKPLGTSSTSSRWISALSVSAASTVTVLCWTSITGKCGLPSPSSRIPARYCWPRTIPSSAATPWCASAALPGRSCVYR